MDIFAPAKINLHLRVGAVRPDGFHPLQTWMVTVGLRDRIVFEAHPSVSHIEMTCSDSSIPLDDRNLVMRAAKTLRRSDDRSVKIHLEKNIPHGAGLGGGSADAAFTLKGLAEHWGLHRTQEELVEMATALGSDVPFFLYGGSAVCTGRGEKVRVVSGLKLARWVVLLLPKVSIATPGVYRRFDEMGLGSDLTTEPDWDKWAGLGADALLPKLVNDLEKPAFGMEPGLGKVRAEIEQQTGRPVRMSGSGSSLFTLYDDEAAAQAAADAISKKHSIRTIAVEAS